MAEQEAEQPGAEEAGRKAAEEAGSVEQAAGLARRRGLAAERAGLAGLGHAALHRRSSIRRRSRRRRRAERVGAAAAEAAAAAGAGVGLARHEGQRRQCGECNHKRTKLQTKRSHRFLSGRCPDQSRWLCAPDGVHIGTTRQEFKTYSIVSQAPARRRLHRLYTIKIKLLV